MKIDRSFVADAGTMMSASIIQAIVALARALGLKITAEGVETEAQRTFLRVCGCHYLQGYLFSKPVSALAISHMLGAPQTERRVGCTSPHFVSTDPVAVLPTPFGAGIMPAA